VVKVAALRIVEEEPETVAEEAVAEAAEGEAAEGEAAPE